MSDFTNFRAVYDELTDEVMRARYQFVAEHLRNWLTTIDETPEASRIVHELQSGLDVQDFLKRSHATEGSMVGSATLLWPDDRKQRLGMKLRVLREVAEGRIEAWNFGHDFMNAGSGLDENARSFADQLFRPTARELRRVFESAWNEIEIIPAADRTVRIDHNNPRFKDVLDTLANLEKAITESNLYDDPEVKEQHAAEISAGRTVLQSVRVRVTTILVLLRTPLMAIAKKFWDAGLGKAASAAWDMIVALVGPMF